MLNRMKVITVLCLLVIAALPAAAQDAPLVGLAESEDLGWYLVNADGMTLYSLSRDAIGESVCVDQCAANWPPLTVESADALTTADGVPGTLGTLERADGSLQVTYNGMPLYTWSRDAAAGDTTGHGVNNVWWVVPPATVYGQKVAHLGTVLVGPTGMTLYSFTNDTPGEPSVCTGGCLDAWPYLTVASADDIVPGVNLPGDLGTVENADGTLQVTYNGWPLYTFMQDAAIGDTTGEGIGGVWFTVTPETVDVATSENLGEYLVSPSGRTLYRFTNDTEGVSNCSGQCIDNWPAFTLAEGERLASGTLPGELATIERADGTLQVTYNGMPLYYFANDAAPGDVNGQGIGSVWFVVAP